MGDVSEAKEIFTELKRQILERVDLSRDVSDEEMQELIDEVVISYGKEQAVSLNERCRLKKELFHALRKMDVLQELLEEPDVTEIMVNGMNGIFLEKDGTLSRWEKNFYSGERILDVIRQITGACNRAVNESQPIVDARLENGDRVHVVLPPVSLDGPVMTIRKFPRIITMEMLVESGSITQEAADFLKKLVRAGYNLFISGGTNSGKTTFLNALSAYIPADERVITIEDSAELQIQQVKNLVRLETRTANSQGEGAIGIGDLIKASLRMNPSRIIVGEVRGKEALELLNSYNTGHDGGMSSGHGNSPKDMLARLETMVLMGAELPLAAIRSQIASALDVMIHLGRERNKKRRVFWIVEVDGYEEGQIRLHTLYELGEQGLEKKGELKNTRKLWMAGEEI